MCRCNTYINFKKQSSNFYTKTYSKDPDGHALVDSISPMGNIIMPSLFSVFIDIYRTIIWHCFTQQQNLYSPSLWPLHDSEEGFHSVLSLHALCTE